MFILIGAVALLKFAISFLRLLIRVRRTTSGLFILKGLAKAKYLRIGEKYDDYEYVIKSVPIQIRFSTQLFKKGDSKLAFDFSGGVNVFNVTADYWRSKTGPLLTMGLSYNLSHKFYIKGGVELQYDKGSYFIFADPSLNIKDERIDYTEKRRQIFAALAIIL